ncbi:putative lysozyme [Pseudomonas phage phiB1_1]|uniref:Lysozyme n=1 Tax=Pseudomonas phage phiB1_1 TaxID=2755402 RepID=A0A7D7J689_9CAUD|nr:putative lysozyme [Pseudomonas phage phiB1_1]
MVQRNAEEFDLRTRGTQQAQTLQLGPGKVERSDYTGPSAGTQALDGLLALGQQAASMGVQQEAQRSYLDGQRARMAGQSQEAVTSDIFSRPFVNGGYQDEDYRIEQATMAREMQELIKTRGQSMSPDEFGRIVQERANKYTSKFSNLSSHGQTQAMTSQESMERSLFSAQAGAYTKWSINEGAKRYLVQGNQILTDLAGSRNDPVSYQANTERAALLYNDLRTSDKLPDEMRQKVATQYLSAVINADQRQVVEQLRDSGMLNDLSFEDRKAIDTQMRESATRTTALDSLGNVQDNAAFESRVGRGEVGGDELTSYITREVEAKRMSYAQAKTLRLNALKGMANQDDQVALMTAVGNRDLNQMAALGYTGAEAIEAMDKQLAKNGVSLPDRLKAGMSTGLSIGQLPKSFGDTIGQSVRSIAAATQTGEVPGTLVESLNGIVSTLTVAEQKNPGARAVLLGAMPDDTKATMSYVLAQQEHGVDPAQAIKEFTMNRDAFAKLDALDQGIKTQAFRTTLMDRVDSEVYSGATGRIGNFLRGASNLSTNPYHAASMGAALTDELANITNDRNNMGLNADSALDLAVSNVQARTIAVGEGGFLGTGETRRNLILPRGVDVQQVFGSSDKQMIGKLLSQDYPAAASGFESSFTFNRATGQLENIQLNDKGQVVQRTVVDPSGIGKRIQEDQTRILDEANAAHFGAPVQVNGQEFRIDGGNSYGIPVRIAYQFRKELTGFEGLDLKVYKDRNGLAVGIGHNVTGQLKEGDTVSREQAEKWFREDSDQAIQQGMQYGRELGVQDPNALMGLAAAAFQLGGAGLREHSRTAEAIKARDFTSFEKEVRSSAWAKQTPERVEWFIRKMAPHFSGLGVLSNTSARYQ